MFGRLAEGLLASPGTEEPGGMNLAGDPPGVDGGIPGTPPPRFRLLNGPSN